MQRLLALSILAHGASAGLTPTRESAEANAFGIFNTVHAAMRQWGSSVHHNGMAFFSAQVPEGTLLYHGDRQAEIPDTFEWLAFEIEHSLNFARSWRGKFFWPPPKGNHSDSEPDKGGPGGPGGPPDPLGGPPSPGGPGHRRHKHSKTDATNDTDEDKQGHRGYMHTYRATRPLKLLYVDGMAAAKTSFGPLDQQDLVLLDIPDTGNMGGEYLRAQGMCDMFAASGVDGIIRMEAGFEIIYCDFHRGLEQLAVTRQPYSDTEPWYGEVSIYEWLRAVARRYDGIGGGRVSLRWSSAVSGWWYGFNTTNTNPDQPELPRYIQATAEELGSVRKAVIAMMAEDKTNAGINWQDVADMIVARFSKRLASMAHEGIDPQYFITQLMETASTYFDTPALPDDAAAHGVVFSNNATEEDLAVARCADSFFYPVAPLKKQFTTTDDMFYTALTRVTREICSAVFAARHVLLSSVAHAPLDTSNDAVDAQDRPSAGPPMNRILVPAVPQAQPIIQDLVRKLDWAEWKRCAGCKADEECFIAMFPVGSRADHYAPRCQNATTLENHVGFDRNDNYWRSDKPAPKEDGVDKQKEEKPHSEGNFAVNEL